MDGVFSSMRIGSLEARNRIVRAATAESLATADGRPTPELIERYRALSRGGVGTIITGYASISIEGKPSECALGMYDDRGLNEYRALVDAVHAFGARIVLQLVYGGSKSKVAASDPRRRAFGVEPALPNAATVDILGASALENPLTSLVPREATIDELHGVAADFGNAASLARACGFDGVEIHAAHGYLLSQFLSRRYNVRSDAYGGSLENRARLLLECVRSVRTTVGEDFPIFAKVNSCDDWDDPQGERGGLSEDECARVCAWIIDSGASCIEVSGDWHAASRAQKEGTPYFAAFGARLVDEIDAPVIVTGGWRDRETIERHMQADGITAVGMSRPFLVDPAFPSKWQAAQ